MSKTSAEGGGYMAEWIKRTSLRGIPLVLVSGFLLSAASPAPDLRGQILAAHNSERASLGLTPLIWDDGLAKGAKQWSDFLANEGRFEHSPDAPGSVPLGENIWGGSAGRFQPRAMVSLWIAEKRYFKPGVFPANSTTGDVRDVSHYTQLVWRGSARVGCGLSRGATEDILVCRYANAGNIIGRDPI
jgi:hypothetical protein